MVAVRLRRGDANPDRARRHFAAEASRRLHLAPARRPFQRLARFAFDDVARPARERVDAGRPDGHRRIPDAARQVENLPRQLPAQAARIRRAIFRRQGAGAGLRIRPIHSHDAPARPPHIRARVQARREDQAGPVQPRTREGAGHPELRPAASGCLRGGPGARARRGPGHPAAAAVHRGGVRHPGRVAGVADSQPGRPVLLRRRRVPVLRQIRAGRRPPPGRAAPSLPRPRSA